MILNYYLAQPLPKNRDVHTLLVKFNKGNSIILKLYYLKRKQLLKNKIKLRIQFLS